MQWKITEQGPRVAIEVWRTADGAGLYKAYIQGSAGRCLLGTLMPEKGRLVLRRTLSIDSLRRLGAWPVREVEEELVCAFREQVSPVRWTDEVLCRSAGRLPRHTLQQEREGFSLRFPFDLHSPFPLTPAFCFARVENGQLIFSFRTGGVPYIFQEQGNTMEAIKEQRREPHGKSDHQGTGCAGRSAGF